MTVVAEGSCPLFKVSAPQFTELKERMKRRESKIKKRRNFAEKT